MKPTLLLLSLAALTGPAWSADPAAGQLNFFENKIRPVLVEPQGFVVQTALDAAGGGRGGERRDQAEDELRKVLAAFRCNDSKAALAVWQRDEELDALYNSCFRQLLTYMLENPRTIGTCTHLLFAAKNMERIGDHATNIAEIIHFEITGEEIISERPKLDVTTQ